MNGTEVPPTLPPWLEGPNGKRIFRSPEHDHDSVMTPGGREQRTPAFAYANSRHESPRIMRFINATSDVYVCTNGYSTPYWWTELHTRGFRGNELREAFLEAWQLDREMHQMLVLQRYKEHDAIRAMLKEMKPKAANGT